jgi:hypothetical protein
MHPLVKLVLGLLALCLITLMTMVFGLGGFAFTFGLFVVIGWAFDENF